MCFKYDKTNDITTNSTHPVDIPRGEKLRKKQELSKIRIIKVSESARFF